MKYLILRDANTKQLLAGIVHVLYMSPGDAHDLVVCMSFCYSGSLFSTSTTKSYVTWWKQNQWV